MVVPKLWGSKHSHVIERAHVRSSGDEILPYQLWVIEPEENLSSDKRPSISAEMGKTNAKFVG